MERRNGRYRDRYGFGTKDTRFLWGPYAPEIRAMTNRMRETLGISFSALTQHLEGDSNMIQRLKANSGVLSNLRHGRSTSDNLAEGYHIFSDYLWTNDRPGWVIAQTRAKLGRFLHSIETRRDRIQDKIHWPFHLPHYESWYVPDSRGRYRVNRRR